MTPAEKIAADTWERLKLSRDLRVRLGEETLTDLLALDFVRLMKVVRGCFKVLSTGIDRRYRSVDPDLRWQQSSVSVCSASQKAVSIKQV